MPQLIPGPTLPRSSSSGRSLLAVRAIAVPEKAHYEVTRGGAVFASRRRSAASTWRAKNDALTA